MKHLKTFFLAISLVTTCFALSSCGESVEAVDKQGKEYTAAYICPMHCKDSGSDQAGKCPTCKMAYVKNENYKPEGKEAKGHEGHDHSGHDHSHDHGSHDGHNH